MLKSIFVGFVVVVLGWKGSFELVGENFTLYRARGLASREFVPANLGEKFIVAPLHDVHLLCGMTTLLRLSSALGQRDEAANQALAEEIAANGDTVALQDLVAGLADKKKPIRSDCIKTLYEIGYLDASLIAPYTSVFVELLTSKDNRMVWGAMIALDTIVPLEPEKIYRALPSLQAAADEGSVITNDHYVGILVALAGHATYYSQIFSALLVLLAKCPSNQLPAYAEKVVTIVQPKDVEALSKVLRDRLGELATEAKHKRLEKVLAKAAKIR